MSEQGLKELISEWRERDAADERRDRAANAPFQVYTQLLECSDQLQPFLERLEALEQRMKHEEKNEYYDAMTPSGMRTFLDQDCMETCLKCQLRSILSGEQPSERGE